MEGLDSSLGSLWYDKFYPEIVRKLGYSEAEDTKARDQLEILLKNKQIPPFEELLIPFKKKIKGRNCLMFGAGPSLREDIMSLYPIARKGKHVLVAADGAADALMEAMIIPDFTVSDLDSCSEATLFAQSSSRAVFVHGHGDNIELMKERVPMLGQNLLGTTQVKSSKNICNLGGLSDGDRACYILSTFGPKRIILAGMDLGRDEGEYSRSRALKRSHDAKSEQQRLDKRQQKLGIARESIEFLTEHRPDIRFANVTKLGERIKGAEKLPIEQIIEELS